MMVASAELLTSVGCRTLFDLFDPRNELSDIPVVTLTYLLDGRLLTFLRDFNSVPLINYQIVKSCSYGGGLWSVIDQKLTDCLGMVATGSVDILELVLRGSEASS